MKKTFISFCAAMVAMAAQPALAQNNVLLEGMVEVEKTIVEDGISKTVLMAPETVVPGDRLIFSTKYRNDSGETVQQFVVTNPVPDAVSVTAQSAGESDVSVDGGTSWGQIAKLTVTDENGQTRAANAADVTHIRWIIPTIAPGDEGTLAYHAIVR